MGSKNSRTRQQGAHMAPDVKSVADQTQQPSPAVSTPHRKRSSTTGTERVVHVDSMMMDATSRNRTAAPSAEQNRPIAVRIRSDQQAVLLATLASLQEGLKQAKTSAERQALLQRLREVVGEYDAEMARQQGDAQQATATLSPTRERSATAPPKASPLRSIKFPTLLYDERRHRPTESSDSEDRIECAICMNTYAHEDEIMVLPCLHWFHSTCGREWLDKRPECPLCQTDVLKNC